LAKFSLMPRQDKFFVLFEESAKNIARASQLFKELVCDWNDVKSKVEKIDELEHAGDTITHKIMAESHRSFVTPFDREDISALAHSMDDIIDFVHSAAYCMQLYKIDQPTQRAKELADIIVQASDEVAYAVNLLRRKSDLKEMMKKCVEINRLENIADGIYRSAMAELFEDSKDMASVIKWREIYELLESATDRCEDVANVLEGVALKHA